MTISKSRYLNFCQCPKRLWMDENKKQEAIYSDATQSRFAEGHEVGSLAQGLFGDFIDVTTRNLDGTLDHSAMIKKTKDCMDAKEQNICEAAFTTNELYCAIDILHLGSEGYEVYEVKSSTEIKDYYYIDLTFQKKVFEKLGIQIAGYYLVYINNQYVKSGDIDLKKLFVIEKVTSDKLEKYEKEFDKNIKDAENIILEKNEPDTDLSRKCDKPFVCPYIDYCKKYKKIPNPSVFDVYGLRKYDYYEIGVVTYDDLLKSNKFIKAKKGPNKEIQNKQIDTLLNDKPDYIDKKKIKEKLESYNYPLCFLDFETIASPIPLFDGTRPYQQIPFQYSLHKIEKEGGEITHFEYLGDGPNKDVREYIAKNLVNQIPENATTLCYNDDFEKNRIKELANAFPQYNTQLMKIKNNIKDLLDIFSKGYYYSKKMGGSFSIKSVLPALFPNNQCLSYKELEGVQGGNAATEAYKKLKTNALSNEERENIRKQLLVYCNLDTMAMVRIWEKLWEVSK